MVYYINLIELQVNQAYSVDIESKYKGKDQESIQSSTTFHMGKSYVLHLDMPLVKGIVSS